MTQVPACAMLAAGAQPRDGRQHREIRDGTWPVVGVAAGGGDGGGDGFDRGRQAFGAAGITGNAGSYRGGGLPANWSAGVNVCHTATLGQYPRLRFGFTNGNATVKSLTALGFILTSGQYGLPTTGLTVCRDGAGNVLSMTVLISLFADEDGTLVDYEVGATNSSPTDGYSYTGVSYLANGGNGGSITAYSSAANLVSIRN